MKRKLLFFLVIFAIVLVFSLFIFEIKLFPIIEKMAIAESRNYATLSINRAIYDVLSLEGVQGDYVELERGEGGEIVSLTTDTYRVNLVKSLVSREVEKCMDAEGAELLIPLGNITGIKLLSGRGPKIKVKTSPVRSVVTDIGSVFAESGINQTWHRVLLHIDADFGVMVLSRSMECHVSDTVVLADTVIVGRVPDAYTDINKIEDELLGDVVDFSASSN
jgi:sporulation protein YunB